MKHKRVVNGCTNKGVWCHWQGHAYCEQHKSLLRGSYGPVHEGRKVGKRSGRLPLREAVRRGR